MLGFQHSNGAKETFSHQAFPQLHRDRARLLESHFNFALLLLPKDSGAEDAAVAPQDGFVALERRRGDEDAHPTHLDQHCVLRGKRVVSSPAGPFRGCPEPVLANDSVP
eukprot:COSAG06_NODE_769_length_12440_cov_7.241796_4_plen_109_part_00